MSALHAYERELDQRFADQDAIDREIARLEAQEMKRYGKSASGLFVEMAADSCNDAHTLVRILYELAHNDVDLLRNSEVFRGMVEHAIAEDLGI